MIGKFTVEEWEFRDINAMHAECDTMDINRRSENYRRNNGKAALYQRPLFRIPITKIIPCMVHCVMSLVKFLRKIVLREIKQSPGALSDYRNALQSLLKLPQDPTFDLEKLRG